MFDRQGGPWSGHVMEQAVAWLARLDAEELSAVERADFGRWLAADPAHQAAYAEVQRLWRDLDRIPADAVARLRAAMDATAGVEIRTARPRLPHRPRRWAIVGAIAASFCLIAVIGADLPTRLQADAFTEIGQTETVALPDGSTAVLNTASAIAIDYSPSERRIRLLRGEAAFAVVRDANRPFRVEAENGLSTALGTVFVVRRREEGATVTVLEGRVAVAYDGAAGSAREAVLTSRQQVTYAAGQGLGATDSVDIHAVAVWRRGKLMFVDCALGEVIDEINRYHIGQVHILDKSLSRMKVSGVFEIRDTVAIVDALEASLGLHSTRFSNRLILLHR